jgi:hypothetical protein
VRVVIYEKSTTDRVRHIRQVIEATAPRWTFKGGIYDAAREALAVLCHKEDDQMEHSQYQHFLSRAREGADAMVLLTKDHDRIRCFDDQVKLTRALDRDLDNSVKEIKQLGEHREEANWKITELEALCKQKEDDAKKLKEKVKLEGIIQSCDELIMEMADEYGVNHMGGNDDEDDEEDDNNDGGDDVAPLQLRHLLLPPR